jgi:hypothetical protein
MRLALMLTLAAPLAAQAPQGWQVRIDRSQNAQDPDTVSDIKVMTMGNGFHVTGGPAGTFWNPANTATGAYAVRGTFTLNRPSSHTNYYGLVFGGSDLGGPAQTYVYFLVGQDGTYIIRHRQGANVNDVRAETPHAAIRRPDASGRSVNDLEVRVAADSISYVVNGTVVHTTPRTGATARTDGLAGVRINHELDVTVSGFAVQRG